VLGIDQGDVEANFNMGLLLMEEEPNPDFTRALHYFMRSVAKDQEESQVAQLLKAQFAKAYYNIALIYDRVSDIPNAATYYKLAIDKNMRHLPHHVKAVTNYAVALEKLGQR